MSTMSRIIGFCGYFLVGCIRTNLQSGWILHFAVLECAPDNALLIKSLNTRVLSETVQRLVAAWSKNTDVTAALGICLEKMGKDDLDATKDAPPSR